MGRLCVMSTSKFDFVCAAKFVVAPAVVTPAVVAPPVVARVRRKCQRVLPLRVAFAFLRVFSVYRRRTQLRRCLPALNILVGFFASADFSQF